MGEEITTRSGHLVGLFLPRAHPPVAVAARCVAQVHDQGGIAIVAHPLVPYPLCAQRAHHPAALDEADPDVPPGRHRGLQPDHRADALEPAGAGVRGGARARGRRRRRRPPRERRRAGRRRRFRARARRTCARPSRRATRPGRATPTPGASSSACSGAQLRKNARAASATRSAGGSRRDGTGRDLGYPGGGARPARFDPTRRRPAGATEERP